MRDTQRRDHPPVADTAAMVPLDGTAQLPPDVIGGKACSVDTIARLGLPVPPAFAIPRALCTQHLTAPEQSLLRTVLDDGLEWLHAQDRRGAASVSVRSSPTQSMPGMLDTVLDVALDDGDSVYDAVQAVIGSWASPRATAYRRHRRLDESAGTAVVIQSMVFGNLDDRSGAGVVFSRNPITGADETFGDWRAKSRGDEVVSGTADCVPIGTLARELPQVYRELAAAARTLERHYTDVQDIEFTVHSGQLWLLQTRTATRSPKAALRVALALREDGVIDDAEVVRRITPAVVEAIRSSPSPAHPHRMPSAARLASGIAAAPGVVSGRAYGDVDEAVAAAEHEDVILVRATTSPGDVMGLLACRGVVTETGGAASHAAVISRELGRPAVVGCGSGTVDTLVGKLITVDGTTGAVFDGVFEPTGGDLPESEDLQEYFAVARRNSGHLSGVHSPSGSPELPLLQSIRLKGRVATADVAELLDLSPEAAAAAVGDLTAAGLVTGTTALRLTAGGRDRLADLLAHEFAGADAASIRHVYNIFRDINADFKAVVTAWQLRAGSPNDHTDGDYDTAVLDRLRRIHHQVVPVLTTVAGQIPRLASYEAKLQHARDQGCAGDYQWLSRPLIDSYHSVGSNCTKN